MLTGPELAGLLYRADWTQLTLSAGITRVTGAGDGPRGAGPSRGTGRLLVAPGRRYRLETVGEDGQKHLKGCDGNRPWYLVSQPEDGSRLPIFSDPQPPEPALLRPSWLLTRFGLGPADDGG